MGLFKDGKFAVKPADVTEIATEESVKEELAQSASPQLDKLKQEMLNAPKTKEEKFKELGRLGKELDKEFKSTGNLIRLGERRGLPVPSRPTNLVSMDFDVFGCGGVPKGRIIEIYGPESAGKTTITLDILAQTQAQGGVGAFIDAEHALDPNYASILGVNIDELWISQPDSGEQALQTVEKLIDSRAVDIIVVDSVSALVPEAELAGDIGDAHIGLQARMMSQACRKLVGKLNKSGVTLIFINQLRDKIGVMFGNPETTTGGKSLKFYASVRLDVRKTKMIGEGGNIKEYKGGDTSQPIGHVIKVKAIKNKVGTPLHETELHHYYETGLDRIYDLMSFASKNGVFDKRGAWIDFKVDSKTIELGNGVIAATRTVKENPELQGQIRAKLYNILFPGIEEAE